MYLMIGAASNSGTPLWTPFASWSVLLSLHHHQDTVAELVTVLNVECCLLIRPQASGGGSVLLTRSLELSLT